MEVVIQSERFMLSIIALQQEIDFDSIFSLVKIQIKDEDVVFSTTMSVYEEDILSFSSGLESLYESLSGKVTLTEPYGNQMSIYFSGDGRGHISISGLLQKTNDTGDIFTLNFIKEIDQTFLNKYSS